MGEKLQGLWHSLKLSRKQLIKNRQLSQAFMVTKKVRLLKFIGKIQRYQKLINVVEQLLKRLIEKRMKNF